MAHELITEQNQRVQVPFYPYILFLLYLEPVSALAGAYFAAFKPVEYLALLAPPSPSGSTAGLPDTATLIALSQLSNLYLLFTLSERLVLTSTRSLPVWRALLFCFLVADFGHLATMARLGSGVFWKAWEWNAMGWGSVGVVYLGAAIRISFLSGVGFGYGGGGDVRVKIRPGEGRS